MHQGFTIRHLLSAAALGVLAVALSLPVRAGDELRFERLADGLERRTLRWAPPGSGQSAVVVHAFRVDPKRFRFRVVRASDGKRDTVHAIARKADLVLAVNASFFDPKGRPLGLLVDRGRELQRLRKVDWGVFYTTSGGGAGIVHRRDFEAPEGIDAAVQSGPRLVVGGKPLDLKPQIARRTAVCVDTSGRVLLLVSESGMLLEDLAALLARPTGEGGLGCRDALNLDGGASTQATLLMPGSIWDLYGGSAVPVVLGIQPRDADVKPGEPTKAEPGAPAPARAGGGQ